LKKKILIFGTFCIWLSIAWWVTSAAQDRAKASALSTLKSENTRLALTFSNELNRVRVSLPELHENLLIKKSLITESPSVLEELNQFLKGEVFGIQAQSIYVANLSGDIIAKGVSYELIDFEEVLEGAQRNISNKPYFQQSSLGGTAEYHDIEHPFSTKSYHFSFPVTFNDKVIGVVVLTYNLADLYEQLNQPNEYINFLVGMDAIIYASSEKELELKSVSPISDKVVSVLQESKRYGEDSVTNISLESKTGFYNFDEAKINISNTKKRYLLQRFAVQNSSWTLFSALDKRVLLPSIINTLAFYITLSALIFIVFLYFKKRFELQNSLANMNTELEQRVEKLTSGLKNSNEDLKVLVEHYQTTQEKLEQTQYELLQTAHLAALGELSATLNHELSQPALALTAYTENSIKLLERGDYKTVEKNFVEMKSICQSMGNIVSTIRTFAKQDSDEMKVASVDDIIDSALPIVKHLIEKSGAKLTIKDKGKGIKVRCIPEQIEQVLVNLISNATEAVFKKPDSKVTINVSSNEQKVKIRVRNNHSDVTNKDLKKLFDPYYTTKEEGTGIGLALCKRIIEAQDGEIKARVCKDKDIEFTVVLNKI